MRMEAVPRGRFTLMAYLSTKWKVLEAKKLPTPIYPYARGLPRIGNRTVDICWVEVLVPRGETARRSLSQ